MRASSASKPRKSAGDTQQGIGVIGVHMLDDAGRGIGQRVGAGLLKVFGADPSHYTKSADVIDVLDL